MVLRRFFSCVARAFREDNDESGRDRGPAEVVVLEVGVAGKFVGFVGLTVLFLDSVGFVFVLLPGAAVVDLKVELCSELEDGTSDTRLGLAVIPSLFFSSAEVLPSIELTDARFSC